MLFVIALLVYFATLSFFGWLITYLLGPLFGRGWRLFVAPGVVVHEVAHALGCVITGAPIHDFNVWKTSGGHVTHGQPKIPIVGMVIISFAPTILMTGIFFAIGSTIGTQFFNVSWVNSVPGTFNELVFGYFGGLFKLFKQVSWFDWRTWLALYGLWNVAATITPSKPDLHNSGWQLGALAILLAILTRFLAWQWSPDSVWPAMAITLMLSGGALVIALLVRFVLEIILSISNK